MRKPANQPRQRRYGQSEKALAVGSGGGREIGVSGGGLIFMSRELGALGCGGRACAGMFTAPAGSRAGLPVSCCTMLRKSLLLILYTWGCGGGGGSVAPADG
ncbi:hypothetical protein M5K25_010172 [Dendrobium thyrsiflorum]|uniref:Uncharacterized protein n=1 Tax=Dendrobium thyrsiflorum TaxID=117978 RepID=A0ABD0V6V6_DENTH